MSLVSLSIGSDDTPLTLATLEADAVELVAARLTAADCLALRMTCSALRLAIGEATWNSIANRAAARIEHQRSSGSVRVGYPLGDPSQEMVAEQAAAGQPQDSRERAAFRHMCSALTQECLDVVSACFSLVSVECIPSGTAAEPSLVPEFYSKVMPVGQVPDAHAEAAFLALDAALSSLRYLRCALPSGGPPSPRETSARTATTRSRRTSSASCRRAGCVRHSTPRRPRGGGARRRSSSARL